MTEHQWRVTWFPPDTTQRTKQFTTEDDAYAHADDVRDDAPIIETRTLTPWRVVQNLTLDNLRKTIEQTPT